MASAINFLALLGLAASLVSPASAWDHSLYTTSPAVLPSPNTTGIGWEDAFAKAKDFLAELTLEEKVAMVTGTPGPCPGMIAPVERLNFTGLCLQDGPLAIRQAVYANVYPAGVNVASTWDRNAFYQRSNLMGQEFKAKGAQIALTPVVGPLGRDPYGGRNWEGFSPDPYLSGIAVQESVWGVQDAGVQATTKHFIGNEQDTQRNPSTADDGTTIMSVSSNIDDKTMHESYLWPFANAVHAGTASVMCSYNRLNGSYGCQNSKILNGLLKTELNFQGFVMSDWGAVHSGVATIESGLDMNMPGGIGFTTATPSYWGPNATAAVTNGTIPESRIDDMVLRVLTPYFHLGQDKDFPKVDAYSNVLNGKAESTWDYEFQVGDEADVVDLRSEETAKFIRESAANGTVLLKNTNGALPLSAPKNVAVFGNAAVDYAEGLYSLVGGSPFKATDAEYGNLASGGGSGTGRFSYVVTPLDALKAKTKEDGSLLQFITSNEAITTYGIDSIFPNPDVCLVFIKSWATEGFDRETIYPEYNGTGVVNTVAASCNNTVVVHYGTGPTVYPFASNPNVTAIIAAHFPGQESGNSLVDILYGAINPSGRLPYTIPISDSVFPRTLVNSTALVETTDPDAWQADFTEGNMIDYRYYIAANRTDSVLYPFGFGLSYTTFNVSDLVVSSATDASIAGTTPGADATIVPGGNADLWATVYTANVTVTNTGAVAGAAVPQLYLNLLDAGAPAGTPAWQLRGFDKVYLAPGESKSVGFELHRRDVSYWDVAAQEWTVPAGEIKVEVGFNVAERTLSAVLA
ncbi:putative beta-glucosidase 1 protein [Neofusicoccum parvum]|uniref:beta-glucosidase n=1 Tax=Botryosphaeria parva (strain UCR-NP2) TaxID=1287680 RepID=R1GL25_BOTPV|nr:putative beta-glucosidase 1 protein [Neofusicoccum parvum UCRNP2]GME65952.1 putative beta-glucosidase 1 protein [Neofusicoccum parvum]